ncbi:CsxC family protein [Chengkuizengella sp. SCS-71B]|uniref:CsxC family protein n=1 Tax=Chengkuizengella sp. SCS-71B TaxID=3115290 RepID=UPI0032C212CE
MGVKVTPILCDCTSQTQSLCPDKIKVDVVVGELSLQIDLEADIELDTPAIDIKDIDKKVFLEQCEFISVNNSSSNCDCGIVNGKVFLGGFVRKNIRYSAADCANDDGVCGEIRHCTVNVPFNCVVPVEDSNVSSSHVEKGTMDFHGRKLKEFNQSISEPYNEPVKCCIDQVTFKEKDLFRNQVPLSYGPKTEKSFCVIREKMVILVDLTLIQKRKVESCLIISSSSKC